MIDHAGYFFISLGVLSVFFAGLAVLRHKDFLAKLNAFVKFAAFSIICFAIGVPAFCGLSPISAKALILCLLMLILLPAESQALICCAKKAAHKDASGTSKA